MNENVLETLRDLLQDVIAPDLRELKVRMESLEKKVDGRFAAMEARFDAMNARLAAMEEKLTLQIPSALDDRVAAHELRQK